MNGVHEMFALLVGLAGSAFALTRISLNQQKAVVERFGGFLEQSLRRQEATNERLAAAVGELAHGVQANNRLLERLAERTAGEQS